MLERIEREGPEDEDGEAALRALADCDPR